MYYPIYFTPDPPHMLKLGINALPELEVLIDADGNLIEWKFIQLLHEEQLKEGRKSLLIPYERSSYFCADFLSSKLFYNSLRL